MLLCICVLKNIVVDQLEVWDDFEDLTVHPPVHLLSIEYRSFDCFVHIDHTEATQF